MSDEPKPTTLERVARAISDNITPELHDQIAFGYCAQAALQALREADAKALHAAFVAMNDTPSGTWKRMKAADLSPEAIFNAKMVPRLTAYIDHILSQTPNQGSER